MSACAPRAKPERAGGGFGPARAHFEGASPLGERRPPRVRAPCVPRARKALNARSRTTHVLLARPTRARVGGWP